MQIHRAPCHARITIVSANVKKKKKCFTRKYKFRIKIFRSYVSSENARVTRIKLDEVGSRATAQIRDSDHIHEKHTGIRQQEHGTVVVNGRTVIFGHGHHHHR